MEYGIYTAELINNPPEGFTFSISRLYLYPSFAPRPTRRKARAGLFISGVGKNVYC